MEDQEIIVLDEPFNALDFKTYADIKDIIRMLQSEGKTILLVSHNFTDIEQLCDSVYMIEDSTLIPVDEEIAHYYKTSNGAIRG